LLPSRSRLTPTDVAPVLETETNLPLALIVTELTFAPPVPRTAVLSGCAGSSTWRVFSNTRPPPGARLT